MRPSEASSSSYLAEPRRPIVRQSVSVFRSTANPLDDRLRKHQKGLINRSDHISSAVSIPASNRAAAAFTRRRASASLARVARRRAASSRWRSSVSIPIVAPSAGRRLLRELQDDRSVTADRIGGPEKVPERSRCSHRCVGRACRSRHLHSRGSLHICFAVEKAFDWTAVPTYSTKA